ncbi:MAG: universal stress protein [Pseudomonadota bacterium]
MQNATILYLVNTETTDDTIREAATRAMEGGAHLRCLIHAAVPIMPFNAMGAAYGNATVADRWPEEVARAQSALAARAHDIEVIFANVGVPGEVTLMFCVLSDIKAHIAACTRSADLLMIAQNVRETTDVFLECVHAGLFNSPVGLLLNAPVAHPEGHVFLAWDDGDAASNAVHKALPLLLAAREITIGCFDPVAGDGGKPSDPGADIAAWLTRHGCQVTLGHYPSGGVDLGTCILNKAAEVGADLIVMGAYGHSRMRQAIFGGTTRTMLEQSERAVFLGY